MSAHGEPPISRQELPKLQNKIVRNPLLSFAEMVDIDDIKGRAVIPVEHRSLYINMPTWHIFLLGNKILSTKPG